MGEPGTTTPRARLRKAFDDCATCQVAREEVAITVREQCPYCGGYWVKVDRIDFGDLSAKHRVARLLRTHVLKADASLVPATREYTCETCGRSWTQPTLE